MSEIQQLLQEIEAFMSGTNRSYQPRLKAMYERYREQCADLANLLAKCKELRDRGQDVDARNFNQRQNPPLTKRFQILNIPQRDEFIALCEDYDLPAMPPWDKDLIAWLEAPVTGTDVNTASLMQQWRKIARNGSNAEKIQILRQIVSASGIQGADWKKNLAELEKKRYEEIGEALSLIAGKENEYEILQKFSSELFSPALLTCPPVDLVNRLKDQLFPLQKKAKERELAALLDEIQFCYQKQDFDALKQHCAKWDLLASSPLAAPTEEQAQTIRDVKSELAQRAENHRKEAEYERLLNEMNSLLSKEAPHEDLYRKYGELQRTEHELPSALVEQMETMQENDEIEQRQRHQRRSIYGFCLAFLFLILTVLTVAILQYRNQIRTANREMTRLINGEEYEACLKLYQKLQITSPRVARSAKITTRHAELRQAIADRKRQIINSQKEFKILSEEITKLANAQELLESQELEDLLARMEKLRKYLEPKQVAILDRFKTTIAETKERIRINREKKFRNDCQAIRQSLDRLLKKSQDSTHGHKPERLEEEYARLHKECEKCLSENNKVNPVLINSQKSLLEKQFSSVEAAIREERRFQDLRRQLTEPASLDDYLRTLSQYQTMPLELQLAYKDANANRHQWEYDKDDAIITATFAPGNGTADSQLKRYGKRSIFLTEYAAAAKLSQQDALETYLTAAQNRFDRYELEFIDQNGTRYFFYCEKPPLLDYSKCYSGRVENLILEADTEDPLKREQFIIQHHWQNKTFFEYKRAVSSSKRELPTYFASLNNWDECTPVFKKSNFHDLLQQIRKNATPETREKVLWDCLQKLPKASFNPILTHGLLLAVLQSISQSSDYFQEQLKDALRDMSALSIPSTNWMVPDAMAHCDKELKKSQKILQGINWDFLRKQNDFMQEFLLALRQRQLFPVGIVTVEKEIVTYHPFQQNIPRELLVIDKGVLHAMRTKGNGDKMAPQDKKYLFNGQVIWGYVDEQTCQEFLTYWRHRADAAKLSLKVKTALCPVEYNYFLK